MPVNSKLQKNKDENILKLCKELELELQQLKKDSLKIRVNINNLVDKKKMVNVFQKIVNLPDK